MKRRFRISSLALAGFIAPEAANATPGDVTANVDDPKLEPKPALLDVFRADHSFTLAGHRSHSSHSSHRSSSGGGGGHSSHSSHRSSTSSGGARSVPATPSPPSSRNRNSTPPSSVLPGSPATAPKTLRGDTEKFKEIVRKVQIALMVRGYYHGAVDGIVGPETKASLVKFQSASQLSVTGTITAETLNALAIVAQ